MAKLSISNEEQLYDALNVIMAEGIGRDTEIEFVNWPRFEITIKGESFHGGVPTRIMPALLDLQKKLDAAFAQLKYGDDRRLTREDRMETELIVRFEAGRSTTFNADLFPILNTMVQEAMGKMDGMQALEAILGIAALFTAGFAWKVYWNSRFREKGLDNQLELSKLETERYEILAKAADRTPILMEQMKGQQSFQDSVVKRMAPGDLLTVGDQTIVDGETGHQTLRRPRTEPIEARVDGRFMIISVDSGQVSGGYRLKVHNVDTKDEFAVQVPDGTLTAEQIEILKSGEWGKKPLVMKLNVKKRADGGIFDARLIEAGLSRVVNGQPA